jgi:hypothetical protein
MAHRRQVLQGELSAETAHWGSRTRSRVRPAQKLAEEFDGHLADPELDPRLRTRYSREVHGATP